MYVLQELVEFIYWAGFLNCLNLGLGIIRHDGNDGSEVFCIYLLNEIKMKDLLKMNAVKSVCHRRTGRLRSRSLTPPWSSSTSILEEPC